MQFLCFFKSAHASYLVGTRYEYTKFNLVSCLPKLFKFGFENDNFRQKNLVSPLLSDQVDYFFGDGLLESFWFRYLNGLIVQSVTFFQLFDSQRFVETFVLQAGGNEVVPGPLIL